MSTALKIKLVDYNRASLMKRNYAGFQMTEQNIAYKILSFNNSHNSEPQVSGKQLPYVCP